MELSGRVAMVTGASRGLGRSLAEQLADQGAHVACIARDAAALDDLVATISAAGGRAAAYPCDLSEPEAAAPLVARIEEELGPVSLLLANAGMATVGAVADLRIEDFETNLRTNFLSAAALTSALLPGLRERGGTLGYVSSGLAMRSLPAWSTYAASKAALRAYADALRIELTGTRVKVLTILPGTMKTGFSERMARVGDAKILEPRGGRSPDAVAKKIVRAIERDRKRVAVFGPSSLIEPLDAFAPGCIDWLLARLYRRG